MAGRWTWPRATPGARTSARPAPRRWMRHPGSGPASSNCWPCTRAPISTTAAASRWRPPDGGALALLRRRRQLVLGLGLEVAGVVPLVQLAGRITPGAVDHQPALHTGALGDLVVPALHVLVVLHREELAGA